MFHAGFMASTFSTFFFVESNTRRRNEELMKIFEEMGRITGFTCIFYKEIDRKITIAFHACGQIFSFPQKLW